jgi:hypothetical protein
MATLVFMVPGLFVLAESDVRRASNADIWGILVFVGLVILVVSIVRKVRRND